MPTPNEAWLESLITANPDALVHLLDGDALEPHLLTFAAEFAGNLPAAYDARVIHALTEVLRHPSAPVREGAVYGLARLLPRQPDLLPVLERHTQPGEEPSPGVRRAAGGVLGR
jgi:hypothetical protein